MYIQGNDAAHIAYYLYNRDADHPRADPLARSLFAPKVYWRYGPRAVICKTSAMRDIHKCPPYCTH